MNATTIDWKKINHYVVLGGAAVIAVTAATQLLKVKSVKEAALPVIFLVTAFAAFNATMQTA